MQEERLTRMEKNAKEAEMLIDLKEHPAVQKLIKELETNIAVINVRLTTERISEHERDLLFAQRDCWGFFIGKFSQAEQTLVNIEKYLEKL